MIDSAVAAKESAEAKPAEPPATEAAPASAPAPTEAAAAPKLMPSAQRVLAEAGIPPTEVSGSGPGGRVLKEDAQNAVEARKAATSAGPYVEAPPAPPAPTATKAPATAAKPAEAPKPLVPSSTGGESSGRREERVRMSKLRRTVAARLVSAKEEAALLTTFNEADMSVVMGLRKEMQEAFTQRHGVKLGFMSFFVKAVIDGLRLVPQLNSEIRGDDIIYKSYFDIGVAIGGGKGLVVPVLRNAERLGFADIEKAITAFAGKAKEGKLLPSELEGGTFTISNGGVYGSLLSTPIVNPPQSGVLGMHTIQERPIALNGQVVIRPMMYLALTYDHRIVDGKEAVTFLKRVKEAIENPARILIEA
jgi:2-oxoglutarate dehydrogenase E2 component (dihydrolipoamide succinyltransferase)